MKVSKYLILLIATVVVGMAQAAPNRTKVFQGYKMEAKYTDEKNYPVVGIGERTPLIMTPDGVVDSGKYFIKVSPVAQINDLSVEIFSVEEKRTEKAILLTVELKSSDPLDSPYAAIIYTDEAQGQLRCKFDGIPGFSGEPEKIKLRFNSNMVPDSGWKLHFFNGQRQLYTNQTQDLKDATPEQAFILHLGRHMASVGSGDANPQPFYMPVTKPDAALLPEGNEPFTVQVQMTIEKTGRVGDFSFVEPVDSKLKSLLSTNIRKWLFFPRVRSGNLEPVTVVLPIKLR
ncbi:hypothetical protein G0Q06_12105 [Puniceicoccales bacterium CK1056]|uniref:TonB C-terminal domain-containing protein n=1 Tax=Oceanipulchritudo coccoides TaxID=2706888 RepID=A0A6B2M4N8_9BACT|nr:hypothetical protein [Oceanipulchritudo coccoides]NDV63199.1 hypothetical protein [Oceanipulchritudo coccoides]